MNLFQSVNSAMDIALQADPTAGTLAGLQIRECIVKLFSLFFNQIICCGYSKEPSQ